MQQQLDEQQKEQKEQLMQLMQQQQQIQQQQEQLHQQQQQITWITGQLRLQQEQNIAMLLLIKALSAGSPNFCSTMTLEELRKHGSDESALEP